MKSLAPLLNLARWHYYRIALRQLSRRDPCHPDVPHLVRLVNDLEPT